MSDDAVATMMSSDTVARRDGEARRPRQSVMVTVPVAVAVAVARSSSPNRKHDQIEQKGIRDVPEKRQRAKKKNDEQESQKSGRKE